MLRVEMSIVAHYTTASLCTCVHKVCGGYVDHACTLGHAGDASAVFSLSVYLQAELPALEELLFVGMC